MVLIKRVVHNVGEQDVEIRNILRALNRRKPKSIVKPTEAWHEITENTTFSDSSTLYWWNVGGAPLSAFLEIAGYDSHSQHVALVFYLQRIAHRLGPASLPSLTWKSFITDDYSPLEFSWTWNHGAPPRVRYGIEPIGHFAGALNDPYNQATTDDLISELKGTNPDIDFRVHDCLRTHLAMDSEDAQISTGSSHMVAFVPWKSSVGVKIYYVWSEPGQRAKATAKFASAMDSLRGFGLQLKALTHLTDFLDANNAGDDPARHLHFEGVAVDCVRPLQSRYKIYCRSRETSFDSVRHRLTLGQEVDTTKPYASYLWTPELLEQLKMFWQLIFGLEENFCTSASLTHVSHQFAGIAYNFDVGEMYDSPCTKLYIPIRHYVSDDAEIARRFGKFLGKMDGFGYFDEFMQALKRVCPHRSLDCESGLQTNLAVGVKKGKLSLTTYVAPEIYNKAHSE